MIPTVGLALTDEGNPTAMKWILVLAAYGAIGSIAAWWWSQMFRRQFTRLDRSIMVIVWPAGVVGIVAALVLREKVRRGEQVEVPRRIDWGAWPKAICVTVFLAFLGVIAADMVLFEWGPTRDLHATVERAERVCVRRCAPLAFTDAGTFRVEDDQMWQRIEVGAQYRLAVRSHDGWVLHPGQPEVVELYEGMQ